MSRPAGFHHLPRDLVGVLASFGSTSALARLNRQTAEDVRVAPVLSTLAEGKRRYEEFVRNMLERQAHAFRGGSRTKMGQFFAERLIQQVFMVVPFPTLYRLFLVDDAFNLEHDTAPLTWPFRTMTARAGDPVYRYGLLSYKGVETLTRVVELNLLQDILGALSISRHPPGQLFQQMARFVCDFSDEEHELHAYWRHHVLHLHDWASRFVRGDLPHQRLPAAVMTRLSTERADTPIYFRLAYYLLEGDAYERARIRLGLPQYTPAHITSTEEYLPSAEYKPEARRELARECDWLTSQPVVEFLTEHLQHIPEDTTVDREEIERRMRELASE